MGVIQGVQNASSLATSLKEAPLIRHLISLQFPIHLQRPVRYAPPTLPLYYSTLNHTEI